MSVIVYTKPVCVQCDRTKKILDRDGVDYQTIDVTEDAEALDLIMNKLGYAAAPVVRVIGRTVKDRDGQAIDSWSGLRPDLLTQLS